MFRNYNNQSIFWYCGIESCYVLFLSFKNRLKVVPVHNRTVVETFLGDLFCNVVSLFPELLSRPKSDHGIILFGINKPTSINKVFDNIEPEYLLSPVLWANHLILRLLWEHNQMIFLIEKVQFLFASHRHALLERLYLEQFQPNTASRHFISDH